MTELIEYWSTWPVLAAVVVALVAVIVVFVRNDKEVNAQTFYQMASVVALVLALPGVLLSTTLNLDVLQLSENAFTALILVNMVSGVIALLVLILAVAGVGKINEVAYGAQFNTPFPTPAPAPAIPPLSAIGGTGYPAAVPTIGGPLPAGYSIEPPIESSPYSPGFTPIPPTPTVTGSAETILERPPFGVSATTMPPAGNFTDFNVGGDNKGIGNPDETILLGGSQQGSIYLAWLIEISGARAGNAHQLPKAHTVIGRSDGSDIRPQDGAISSRHAAIVLDEAEKRWILHDLGSANGTYWGNQKVTTPHPLQDRDRIRLGQTVFHFMEIRLEEVLDPAATEV